MIIKKRQINKSLLILGTLLLIMSIVFKASDFLAIDTTSLVIALCLLLVTLSTTILISNTNFRLGFAWILLLATVIMLVFLDVVDIASKQKEIIMMFSRVFFDTLILLLGLGVLPLREEK